MNYYRRYVGDYAKATTALSLAEHGAYALLLDAYYADEHPLPADLAMLFRICRATTPPEQDAVKYVAEKFFPICDDRLRHNRRADNELSKAKNAIEQMSEAGTRGAQKRWGRNGVAYAGINGVPQGKMQGNDGVTHAGGDATTNHQPPSSNHQPPPKRKGNVALTHDAEAILGFLNEKTGRHYKPCDSNIKLIAARLRDGETADDMRAVVAMRCRKWRGDPKMDEYLRPKTLFNATNYAQYRGELKDEAP